MFKMPSLGYEVSTSWPILEKAYPSKVAYTISEDDVETYNWSDQTITLTSSASLDFLEATKCREELDIDYTLVCLEHHTFVVAVDGKPVYGGLFCGQFSPMAIKYPVIHSEFLDDKVVLTLRPEIGFSWIVHDENIDWRGIKDERIENLFEELGKLVR